MKLIVFLLLVSTNVIGQSENGSKFKVQSIDVRVATQDGGWTQWKKVMNFIDTTSDESLTVNFTNKTILNDFKIPGGTREFHTYKIISYSTNKSYQDFGVFLSNMQIDEGQGEIKKYVLAYLNCDNNYILITYSKNVQSRYFLTEL
jgi:hypothetical protein